MAETIVRDPKKKSGSTTGTAKKKVTAAKKDTEKKVVSAAKKEAEEVTAEVREEKKIKTAKPKGSAIGYRIGAVVCWLLALACEVIAILCIQDMMELFPIPQEWNLVICLAVDLIFLVIGSQLWKTANRIAPASSKDPLKFWLFNNLGVIVAALCFIPFIVIALTNKKANQKTKLFAVIAAVVGLLIGGLSSYTWHPVSQEMKQDAEYVLEGIDVYWSPGGHRYHLDDSCSAISNSAVLTKGTVKEAIEADREYLCKFCLNHHPEIEGAENLVQGAKE